MTPAERVISKFGGIRPLARMLDIDHSSVQRWTRPKTQRGSGGLIPSRHHQRILNLAREQGLDIDAADLIVGGDA